MGSIKSNHFDVVVVGAGPVGLLTAINVAKAGVKVLVLEQGDGIDQSLPVTSYQLCVMAKMQESGILEDIKKKAIVNNILSFWVGKSPEKEQAALVEKLEGGEVFLAGPQLIRYGWNNMKIQS